MTHSVTIDRSRCCGCTQCLQVCPTEAIRVERSRAVILADRCVDCGRCVGACPYHAVGVSCDELSAQKNYEFNVALVDTVLYGQFENLTDPNVVLEGLLKIGFDDVFEVGEAAEMMTLRFREEDAAVWKGVYPLISTDCPASVNLVRQEYPELTENLAPTIAPFELAAILARRAAEKKTGLPPERIGIGYISPCSARVTQARFPTGLSERVVDYVLSMREVYVALLSPMKKVGTPRPLSRTGKLGMNWSRAGGQSANLHPRNCLNVDGADSVLAVLDYLEDGKLASADYVELTPCVQGCFGGCLTVDNAFNAKLKMRHLIDPLPASAAVVPEDLDSLLAPTAAVTEIEQETDFASALRQRARAEEILRTLPGFDCGSCGAPSCRAFSGDVASGAAPVEDCIYNIIKMMRGENADHSQEDDAFVPPTFRRPLEEGEDQ